MEQKVHNFQLFHFLMERKYLIERLKNSEKFWMAKLSKMTQEIRMD